MTDDFDEIMLEVRRPALTGPRVTYEELTYDREAYAYSYQGCLFTGVAYDLWPDGKLRAEDELIDGLCCGLGRAWYSNGQREEAGFVWNDGLHGELRGWDDRGHLTDWGWSEFGISLESKRWDEKGRLIEHVTLAKDDPLWTIWNSQQTRFEAGKSDFPRLPPRPQPPVLPNETESIE